MASKSPANRMTEEGMAAFTLSHAQEICDSYKANLKEGRRNPALLIGDARAYLYLRQITGNDMSKWMEE